MAADAFIRNLTIPMSTRFFDEFIYQVDGLPFQFNNLYSAWMQIRTSWNASDFIVELTDTNGYITLGATDGSVQFLLPPLVTQSFDRTLRVGVYDLIFTLKSDPTSAEKKVKGKVEFVPGVTHA